MSSNLIFDDAHLLKNDLTNPVKKSNVHFKGDPIIIGYCDRDSGNEEELESNYSSSDDDDKFSDDDCEFRKLTKSNTKFNSIASNLRQTEMKSNKNFLKKEFKLDTDLNQTQVISRLENDSSSNDIIKTSTSLNSHFDSLLNQVEFKNLENNDKKSKSAYTSTIIEKSDVKLDVKKDPSNGYLETLNYFQKSNVINETLKTNKKKNHLCSKLNGLMNKETNLRINESINDVIKNKLKKLSQSYKPFSVISSKGLNKVIEFNNFCNEHKRLAESLHYNKKQRSISQDSAKSLQDLAKLAQELELARSCPIKLASSSPIQMCKEDSKFYVSSQTKPTSPPRFFVSTLSKFSLKKLFKFKFNKENHEQETVNECVLRAKAWKTSGLELNRSKIKIIHPAHLNEPKSLENLKSLNCSSKTNAFVSSQNEVNGNCFEDKIFKPAVPARKNKPTNLNPLKRTSPPSFLSFYSTTQDLISSSTRLPPSPPPSPPSPVPLSSLASSHLIINDLTINNAYLSITKYNFDTINKMLLDYSSENQIVIKNFSLKDIVYQSSYNLNQNVKICKTSILGFENITANLLVTPRHYVARSESFQDFLLGQYIDEENKIFAIFCEYETFFTMDKLVLQPNEFKIELTLKQSLIILLQLIDIFQNFQTNGLKEMQESNLKDFLVCLNSKSAASTHIIYQSLEYLSTTSLCTSHTNSLTFVSSKASSSDSNQSSAIYSFSSWLKLVLKILESKVNEKETFSIIYKILEEEKEGCNILIQAKIIFEIVLFQIPLDFKDEETLSIWFDIQRSKFINVLNYQLDSNLNSKKSIYNYYYLLFITRSNFKLLFQALNKLKKKILL